MKKFMLKGITSILLLIVTLGFIQKTYANESYEFTQVTFESQYALGETIELPTVYWESNQQSIEAESVIYLPNGDAYKTNKLILDQFGKYVIEYRLTIDGKLYYETYEFIVIEKLFSFLNDKSSAVYDIDLSSYQTGIVGTNVSLERGDLLTYNGVIDLSKLDGDTPAVELFVTPQGGFGTKDVKKIIFEFIDIYDESNRVKVIGNAVDDDGDPGQWWTTSTYLQAGAFDSTSGIEWHSGLIHKDNMWGFPARFSFYGMQNRQSVVGEEFLSIAFDLDKKQVFGPAGTKGNFIIDLDDNNYVSKAWDGFTTGEVYMTISADGYSGQSFDFIITKVGLNDISPIYNYDLEGPNINIDFGMLDPNHLPKAKIGYSYPVFSATGNDSVTKESPVQTRVFYNYYSSQRFELPINNNRFKVNRAGMFTLEYTSKDKYGNKTVKLVHLETTTEDNSIDLDVEITSLPNSGVVGSRIDIPNFTYSGGFGALKSKVYIKFNNSIIPVENNHFRPAIAGTYEIVFEVEDTIGQVKQVAHQLLVDSNNLPVFVDDPVLPKYLIAGSNYEIFNLRGFDYNSNQYVETEVFVTDGHGQNQKINGYTHNFKANDNGQAIITYKAINQNGFTEISYTIEVVTVKDPFIDMAAYFVGQNLVKNASSNHITISNENINENVSFDFANLLNGNQFSLRFRIDPLNSDFNRIEFYLTDYENHNEQIKISFVRLSNTNNMTVEVNDQLYPYNIITTFTNGGEIHINYNNFDKTLSINNSEYRPVLDYLNKTKFEGFSSSSVYLTGNLKEITNKAAIQVININGQLLSNDDADFVRPYVSIEGVYKSTYLIDEIATIYKALAFDVLDPEVITSLTVKDQTGQVITSLDGVKLENVSFNRDYEIKLSSYGSYLVTYEARDTNGSGRASFTYAMYVADLEKPEITVSKNNMKEASLNKVINIQPATAHDKVDGNLKVTYFIVLPTGEIVHVKDNNLSFTPTLKGIHKIRYFSVDLSGNQVFVDHEVIVK